MNIEKPLDKESIPFDHQEMTDAQMKSLFVELYNTIYWQAILRLMEKEDKLASDALKTIDTFKEPTLMARTQGWLSGLHVIEQHVNAEVKRREDIK